MDTVEQIVALAQLRWLQAETVQVVLTGKPSGHGPNEGNLPKWSEWEASIRLGGGEWGDHVGVGKCPDLALHSLLGGLLAAHRAVDVRRAEVLAEATKGHLPKSETEVDGPAFNLGRHEGQSDVKVAVRKLVDPEDVHHYNLDGVLNAVARNAEDAAMWRLLTTRAEDPASEDAHTRRVVEQVKRSMNIA